MARVFPFEVYVLLNPEVRKAHKIGKIHIRKDRQVQRPIPIFSSWYMQFYL